MRYWTGAEEKLLLKLHQTHSDARIGDMLGRSATAVRSHRCLMGLQREEGQQVRTRVAPKLRKMVPSREYHDCMDWPYPFVKPKEKQL